MSEPASTSELPRVRIVFTGGTISMRDDDGKGAVPVLKGEDLLREAPGIVQVCRPEINDFGQLPGPHMTPDRMMELASLVRSTIEADKADAIVITHGTDTLEETAYLLDLLHNTPHPVVFVGAMRTSSQPSWDGPVNLLDACRVAASQEARGLGVLVVMNSTVHAAGEVTKTYTEALDTFRAPDTGPLGIIDGDELVFSRRPTKRATLYVDRLEPKVGLVVASAGEDGRMIDHLAERGEFGIVVEALGRGNLPPAMARACGRPSKSARSSATTICTSTTHARRRSSSRSGPSSRCAKRRRASSTRARSRTPAPRS